MVVFVCSPYGGRKKNITAAINYFSMEIEMGNVPYSPIISLGPIIDNDMDWRHLGLEILERCDECHIWGDKVTRGMQLEIDAAESMGVTVRYM